MFSSFELCYNNPSIKHQFRIAVDLSVNLLSTAYENINGRFLFLASAVLLWSGFTKYLYFTLRKARINNMHDYQMELLWIEHYQEMERIKLGLPLNMNRTAR